MLWSRTMSSSTWAWSALLLKKCQRYGRWLPNLFRKQNIITALQVNKQVGPLWQRSQTWQVQNRGLILISVTVYSGLPEVAWILPNCLHSILNRYSLILIKGEFTFKEAQYSHSWHMVILATLAVLHYNTGGLCDALHRTKRISSLPPPPPTPSLVPHMHTDIHINYHGAKYIKNSSEFSRQQISKEKGSIFLFTYSVLLSVCFFSNVFLARDTDMAIYNNSCINMSHVGRILNSQRGIFP